MFEDYYKILGIHPGSNEQMIIDAYKLKVQKLEVNTNSNKEQLELLETILKTLMDIPSRVEYDKLWLKYKSRKSSFISNDSPIINILTADKMQFETNQEITITWKTSNCDKVFLSVFGNVEAEGEYKFKVENDQVFYLNIELIGTSSNPFSKVLKSIRLNRGSTDFSENR